MLTSKIGTAVLLSAALGAWAMSPAVADSRVAAAKSSPTTQRDFTRLSVAGEKAFDDVALARLAIFDGHPDRATSLIAQAEAGFQRASTDQTAFSKAEAALQPPASLRSTAAPSSDASTPRTWIPVSENFVVNETLAPPAGTAAAVGKANASLKNNRRDEAFEALKVARVSALDTVGLAPLDASMADIHRASQLAAAADYYGASQSLRLLEDGVRYDTVDVTGTPHPTSQNTASAGAAPAMASEAGDAAPAGDHVAQ